MNNRFRQFIEERLVTERRHFMALHSTRYNDKFDLPISVTNFLSLVEPKFRSSALTWIMTEGLRHALMRRRTLADNVSTYLSKKYGKPIQIPQDSLFSKKAYKEIPELAQLASTLEKDWFDQGGEPPQIRVRSQAEESQGLIDVAQINAHLEKMGRQPLYFGGPDGLIEYLERGDWAKDQLHTDSRHDKQGHDLSLPPGDDGVYQDRETGRQMYKFGLGKNGFVPSTNPNYWQGIIRSTARSSNMLLSNIIKDLQSGKPLDNKELAYIEQMVKDGKIKSTNVDDLLSAVMGVANKVSGEPVAHSGTPEDFQMAKAGAKAVIKQKLMTVPPPAEQTFTMDMGNDPLGKLPPARITVPHRGEIQVPDDLSDPAVVDRVANDIVNLIFDDENGTVANRIRVNRGSVNINGENKRYFINKDTSALLGVTKANSEANKALAQQIASGEPITVTHNGEEIEFNPQDILNRMKRASRVQHTLMSPTVSSVTSRDLKPISDEELAGFQPVGKKGNVVIYERPGTHIKKKVLVRDGQKYEYLHAGHEKIDVDTLKAQGAEIKSLGHGGKYAKITTPDGKEMLVKRHVGHDGKDSWHRVGDTQETPDSEALLTPLNVNVHSGQIGVSPSMKYDPNRTSSEFEDFLDNWQMYGEPGPPDQHNIPQSVLAGMNSLMDIPKSQKEPFISAGLMALSNNIGAVSFKYGDLKPRQGEDIFKLLGKIVSPEEVQPTVDAIDKVIFQERAKTKVHKEGAPFVAPNSFRLDVFQTLLRNGYIWRKRKAASGIRSELNRSGETKQRGLGQGGKSGEEAPDWEKVLASQEAEMDDLDSLSNDDDLWGGDDADSYGDEDIFDKQDRHGDEEYGTVQSADDLFKGGGLDDLKPTAGAHGVRDLEKIANPKGIKRNVGDAYAVKAGIESKPFHIGRARGEIGKPQPTDEFDDYDNLKAKASQPAAPAAPKPSPAPAPRAAAPVTRKSSFEDDLADFEALKKTAGAPAPQAQPPVLKKPLGVSKLFKLGEHSFLDYQQWVAEQEAVFDPKVKVKDGGGFNWWGAAGHPLGVSIKGNADTSKSDPAGKGTNGKRKAGK